MKSLDYGKDYQYSHDFKNNFVEQEFLPEELLNTTLFEPQENPLEAKVKARLKELWKGRYGY